MRTRGPPSLLLHAAVGLTMAGCAGAITVEHDPDLGVTVTRTRGNVVDLNPCLPHRLIANAARVDDSDGPRYVLWIQLEGPDAVRPNLFKVRVDEEVWTLAEGEFIDAHMACPEQSEAERGLGITETRPCVYTEIYWYEVTAEQLRRLAAAASVTMRLEGRPGFVERKFSPDNLESFQSFVLEQVPGRPEF